MKGTRVCIAKVIEVRPFIDPAQLVIIEVRNAENEAKGIIWSHVSISAPCYRVLVGKEAVVGDVVKFVTSEGMLSQ